MGYTHYWRGSNIDKTKLAAAIDDMALVGAKVNHYPAGPDGSGDAEFSFDPKGVYFNGIGEDSYEAFCIDSNWSGEFGFCKTAHKPYDEAVTACLCLLKHNLGDSVNIRSDGTVEEWEDGLHLAQLIQPSCKCPL